MDFIDSVCKNIKYKKKFKDILPQDSKNGMSDFIQNEIKQKLKKNVKRALIKKIIATLEKEIEFLTTVICSKN